MGVIAAAKRNPVLAVIMSVFDWYPSHYPTEERKLLRKLDLAILVFGCLSFFCRFLGQQNVTNAYVSGMREDLNAFGNELNYYLVASPFLLPSLQICWAVIAFGQSEVTQNWQLYMLRAMTGFLEASSFGGTHLILGSWLKNEELFKRAGVWFMGNSVGSMFSGYFQAAIYSSLNGVGGRAGWQWLFLIQGVITLPIAFLGFAFWPGLPTSPRRWYLTAEEHALCLKRIPTVESEGITWKTFKYALTRPMWWICVPCYICLCQSAYWINYMQLWLDDASYSVELVNILPTFVDLIRALSSWLGTTLAGSLSLRGLWTFQFSLVMFAIIVLTVWNVPDPLKFLAFYLGGFSGMASPILYSWVNYTLKENYGERGLVISSMMTFGFTMQIWIPLFTFPTVEAPEFRKGYPASVVFEFLMWGILMFGASYMKRWKGLLGSGDLEVAESGGEEGLGEGDRKKENMTTVVVAG